jgi:flotillin
MGNIDNLTVLSNDGASDVVRNVTRTVTEAGTTVKGLTGIDIPAMLSQAMGGAGTGTGTGGSGGQPPPSGSGGGTRRPSSGPRGGAGGRGTGPTPSTAQPPSTAQASAPPAAPSAPTTPARSAPAGSRSTPPPTVDLTTPTAGGRPPAPPRFESQEQIDSALDAANQAIRAAGAAVPRTDSAAGSARPARPASLDITRETTVDDAASRLATDLRAVPGIARFGQVQLAELERSGPRPLRTMWRIAREQLDDRFGQMTIGELIDRYGSDRRSS